MGDEGAKGPAPEVLQSKSGEAAAAGGGAASASGGPPVTGTGLAAAGAGGKRPKWMKRGGYRPSHKATFIGLAAVAAILIINGVIIGLVIRGQNKKNETAASGQVTISADTLNKVGINRTSLGTQGVQLTVNPDAKFGGKVEVSGEVSIAGQLKLNDKLNAGDATITKLAVNDAQLSQLNINGAGTATTINVRNDLNVAGTSRFQGEVIISRLTTINNSVNISGNLAVGGTLSVQNFQASKFTADQGITVGGKIVTRGATPTVVRGPAMGPSGTVAISGNDVSGSVSANAGVSAPGGLVATVNFASPYSTMPHISVTPVGLGLPFYITRATTGFSIFVVGSPSPGSYAFDFIVMQ